jgi:hypothetical protein
MTSPIHQVVVDKITTPLEVNDEIERRQLASAIAGYFEEFDALLGNLKSFRNTLSTSDNKAELDKHIVHLESLMLALSNHQGEIKDISLKYKCKVERLGITGQIIAAKQNGATLKVISETFNVSEYHLRQFFQIYSNSSLSEQALYRKKSIFDVTDRLEELTSLIRTNLARLDGNDPKNQVLYVREMRECISLASEITEKIVITKQLEQMIKVVGDILISEVPLEKRQQVLSRLAEVNTFNWMQSTLPSTQII